MRGRSQTRTASGNWSSTSQSGKAPRAAAWKVIARPSTFLHPRIGRLRTTRVKLPGSRLIRAARSGGQDVRDPVLISEGSSLLHRLAAELFQQRLKIFNHHFMRGAVGRYDPVTIVDADAVVTQWLAE